MITARQETDGGDVDKSTTKDVVLNSVDDIRQSIQKLFPGSVLDILVIGSDDQNYSESSVLPEGVAVSKIKLSLRGEEISQSKEMVDQTFRWNGSDFIDVNGVTLFTRLAGIKS